MKIVNHSRTSPGELRIRGWKPSSMNPELEFVNLYDGQFLRINEFVSDYVIGYVDDPESIVTINGISAEQNGHAFWIRGSRLYKGPSNTVDILVKALTGDGDYTEKSITIYIGKGIGFVSITPDNSEIIYTRDSEFSISGRMKSPALEVVLNGESIQTRGKRFSSTVPLKAGLNTITVELFNKGGILTERASWNVVRVVQDPVLVVSYPQNGMLLNSPTISISGYCPGFLSPVVSVGEQYGTVNNNSFVINNVPLVEGENTIIVECKDSVLDSRTATTLVITRDSIPPVVEITSPQAGSIMNNASVTIR